MPFDSSQPTTETKTLGRRLLDFYGDNEEKWCRWQTLDKNGRRCLHGALIAIDIYGSQQRATLAKAINLLSTKESREQRVNARSGDRYHRGFYDENECNVAVICNYNNGADSFDDIKKLLETADRLEKEEKCHAI